MEVKNSAIMTPLWVVAVAICIVGAYQMGLLSSLGLAPASVAFPAGGTAAQGQQITVVQGGGCPDTGVVDIRGTVVESIANSLTGVKTQVGGNMFLYKVGSNDPFTTITLSTTVAASSGTDPACGEQIVAVYENATYYHAKSAAFATPNKAEQAVSLEADLIGTMTLYGFNSTAPGTLQTTSMTEAMGTDETMTLDKIAVQCATARGVCRGALAFCFDYSTANFSSVSLVGGKKVNVPTGAAGGFEECWQFDANGDGAFNTADSVKDYGTAYAQLKIVAASGVNPAGGAANNITVRVIDWGTYRKNAGDFVYDGYQNEDTLATIGATDRDFNISVS